MVISPLTAKTHMNRAMAKLHARDGAQLVVLAYESGLVNTAQLLTDIHGTRPQQVRGAFMEMYEYNANTLAPLEQTHAACLAALPPVTG